MDNSISIGQFTFYGGNFKNEMTERIKRPASTYEDGMEGNNETCCEEIRHGFNRDYLADFPNPHPWVIIGLK